MNWIQNRKKRNTKKLKLKRIKEFTNQKPVLNKLGLIKNNWNIKKRIEVEDE